MPRQIATLDANEAVARIAHRTSEVIAVYPITPSSTMGELADQWSAEGRTNFWGAIPIVAEMQSEGGAAGAVHGALQGGALATTFTASQGLLLMIPNLYKIAGELTPVVIHVAARTVATHALSIFGDHSDVMATRACGTALLASASVQEAHDAALIALAGSLESRLPVLHFFDGFRTSHEMQKIELLDDGDIEALLDPELIAAHRNRALNPERPVLRGTAQNPDVFFQAREASNRFYQAAPATIQRAMDRLGERTGRRYRLFEYAGAPDAERVIVVMGSAAKTVEQTARVLNSRGERVGVVSVRLYRPFDAAALRAALPRTVRRVAVLDRTKEPGAPGEPLFLDVLSALCEAAPTAARPLVVGGRYGLSSKEFTPAMAKAVFDELATEAPRSRFTVGIVDDVTRLSLEWDPGFTAEPDDQVRAVFWGLGSDGTVGATKNSIAIIGNETSLYAQGYFVYDSKKAGAVTVSHVRFGPRPIEAPYLIREATFVACHQFDFLDRFDVLESAAPGAVLLLNAPGSAEGVWDRLSRDAQDTILAKHLEVYAIDALAVARAAGLGGRINTVMQTCFFAISGVLPRVQAIEQIKAAIGKSYAKRGQLVIEKNYAAVDQTLAALRRIVPNDSRSTRHRPPIVSDDAPDFVKRVTAVVMAGKGDLLPVSAFPVDGTWPTATAQWEKRDLAVEIPNWDPAVCIQCNWCALVCPHGAIRTKVYAPALLASAPADFQHTPWRGPDFEGQAYTVQVAPEDCTGCSLCASVCPAKDKGNPRHKALDMAPKASNGSTEADSFRFFLGLPEISRADLNRLNAKTSQLLLPLFEFSGACAGCGETPYLKLLTQLFGDKLIVANATGCSSIYGGNLPTTPWTTNRAGKGPAWANSLFEDNAEFGFGIRLAMDARQVADRSVWLVGGDGWAYDIGYGGLDHVLAQDRNVNLLVLDTEVYSNTGGQQSKATPLGAAAKFAMAGKAASKKDLGLEAMSYGHVYVARVAFGADMNQTVKAFEEAESFPGPSLIIAYSPCIAHGYDLRYGVEQQQLAVKSGVWPLYRFDPRRIAAGLPPLELDSKAPSVSVAKYRQNEARFRMAEKVDPSRYRDLVARAERDVARRWAVYQYLAGLTIPKEV